MGGALLWKSGIPFSICQQQRLTPLVRASTVCFGFPCTHPADIGELLSPSNASRHMPVSYVALFPRWVCTSRPQRLFLSVIPMIGGGGVEDGVGCGRRRSVIRRVKDCLDWSTMSAPSQLLSCCCPPCWRCCRSRWWGETPQSAARRM